MSFKESDCWIELVDQPIDVAAVQEFVTTRSAGAVVLFLGTVREMTGERQTVALDYQAYPEMAIAKMQEIASEAKEKWPIQKVAVIHRTGRLELAEASVVVGVSTPHRGDSFAAGQYLIDELKVRVPVWKRENWVDGTTEWVHPGADAGLPASEAPDA
ncbi:molybdenum cofactor biosynthesis protein MoaE [Thalassoglobus sp. JC818]|uniref:molybdenum cofactor biosynthesis protein MoaE n=1 Tax=Thalassoglobus sp. JC818 TaxID=3232136 RepID=UPI0034584378